MVSSYCMKCGAMVDEWDSGYYARGMLCINCYNTKAADSLKAQCSYCGRRTMPSDGKEITGKFFCSNCYGEEEKRILKATCHVCGKMLESWEPRHTAPDGSVVCENCYKKGMGRLGIRTCHKCGDNASQKFIDEEGRAFCLKCAGEATRQKSKVKSLESKFSSWLKKITGNE